MHFPDLIRCPWTLFQYPDSSSIHSVFRLKVQLAGKALLVQSRCVSESEPPTPHLLALSCQLPVSSNAISGSVFGLAQELATRFGIDRISELRTGDGFLIGMNDNVQDVIESGDILIGLDYAGFLAENNQNVRDFIWTSVRYVPSSCAVLAAHCLCFCRLQSRGLRRPGCQMGKLFF
jgi:hypothetical protein